MQDKRPASHYHIGSGVAWVEQSGHFKNSGDDPAVLPPDIFGNLAGGELASFGDGMWFLCVYDTHQQAIDALNAALDRCSQENAKFSGEHHS